MIRHNLPLALALALGAALIAGCGSGSSSAKGAKTLSFKLTDAGCDPHDAKVTAGPVNFEVENDGADGVTELELLDGDSIVAEVENLSDGLSGNFSANLDGGEYTLYCPGGEAERGTLTVTGTSKAAPTSDQEKTAVAAYRRYVERNTAQLVAKTEPFVAAVESGNVDEAKSLYPAARIPYERIEPVAESFGDLDPKIDARINDVPPSQFGGFHKIEQALWAKNSTAGMAPVARQLLADIKDLQQKVKTVKLQAAQIANGANELLGEVSASKITGEEERYSHIDLVDFEANVQGSQAAFVAVKGILQSRNPGLTSEIEKRFAAVYAALKPHQHGETYVSYTELSKSDTRKLARQIDALAEPLSQVAAQVV
jgi:iron uptake system component EfeO